MNDSRGAATTRTGTMPAWRQTRYGEVDEVARATVQIPAPGRGEVLMRLAATGLNNGDIRVMRGEPRIVRLVFGMTRPRQASSSSIARSNRASMRWTSARIAAASVSSTFRASARSATRDPGSRWLRRLHDGVDRHQPTEQRFEKVQPERVLRIALRARRFLVHLEAHAVPE